MKKIVSIISCLALVFSMTACKGQPSSITSDEESSSDESVSDSSSSENGGAESIPESSFSASGTTTSEPESSSASSEPTSGSTSSEPTSGSTSSEPTNSSTSSTSASSSTSSKPTSSSTSSKPTSSSTSSNPTSSSTSSKPTSSSTSSKPASSTTTNSSSLSGSTPNNTDKGVTDYSYTITPLLEPFNEYFFVKTDNPDPTSFRFSDKSSKYDDDNTDAYIDAIETRYADIKYENSETGRVNGGYIFYGYSTDGGEVVLQSKTGIYSWDVTWDDTNLKYKLPALKDDTDYLIDTYANKSNFFDNMDAVEKGFSDICLYSGSYIRGAIYKAGKYWYLSNSPHVDQSFYLQSPYSRNDNQSLFASAIYPFRYDSLGFPSMMGSVAKRLNSASSYKWSSYSHAFIDVTYNGETHSYGGQGEGKGQGIEKSNIKQYFTFGTNGTNITLTGSKKLLEDYSKIQMADDVPRKDALTWKNVYDTVGSGSWVKLTCIGSIFGATGEGYAYLYRNGDGSNFYVDPSSSTGGEIYWGGDIGYASNVWVDGRYIDSYEVFVKGAKFEDHPTSNIIIKDCEVPQVKYKYNSTSGKYEVTSETVTKKTVEFIYDSTDKDWKASAWVFDNGSANVYRLADLVNSDALDEKYLDMVVLTLDEVKAMKVDKNTNTLPGNYYIYDGSGNPGSKNN